MLAEPRDTHQFTTFPEGAKMQSNSSKTSNTVASPNDRAATVKQAVMAAILGLFLVWVTGLSQISVLHNAAHDTRHSVGFPCH